MLAEYHWPGNVRELKNLIERIVILNPQVRVDARHIPLAARAQPQDRPLDRFGSLQEVREAAEREYILKKARRDQRQRHPHRRVARPGAQQPLPQDEDAGDRAEGIGDAMAFPKRGNMPVTCFSRVSR